MNVTIQQQLNTSSLRKPNSPLSSPRRVNIHLEEHIQNCNLMNYSGTEPSFKYVLQLEKSDVNSDFAIYSTF